MVWIWSVFHRIPSLPSPISPFISLLQNTDPPHLCFPSEKKQVPKDINQIQHDKQQWDQAHTITPRLDEVTQKKEKGSVLNTCFLTGIYWNLWQLWGLPIWNEPLEAELTAVASTLDYVLHCALSTAAMKQEIPACLYY